MKLRRASFRPEELAPAEYAGPMRCIGCAAKHVQLTPVAMAPRCERCGGLLVPVYEEAR